MKTTLVFDGITATATKALAAETPFQRGNTIVLMVCPDKNFDGTITFQSDDAATGTYADIVTAQSFADGMVRLYEIEAPHNLRASVASRTAGAVDVYVVGE